jgi:23S rRNA G2069 N7-methylase RlmK/C1962 C5-methylase RlmI
MYDYNKEFRKILKTQFQQLRKELFPLGTKCMRVYDHNISTIPATVELFDKFAKIAVSGTSELPQQQLIASVAGMLYIPKTHVFYQQRLSSAKGGEKPAVLKKEVETEQSSITVTENGLKFIVDLGDRTDTGLFLDHMPTRMMVRDNAFGMRVLNLFSYTGSFSVYAASGGAEKVVSVDLSNTYSRWAEKNLQLNGFFGSKFPCIRSDAKRYLQEQASSDGPFDLIICDPPSFSNSNKMDGVFDVQKDYIWYIEQMLKLLVPKGVIIFSTNLKGFHFDPGRVRGAVCKNITKQTIPPGFSKKRVPHICYLITKR